MLTFLFGRSGSGKTSYIIEKITESVKLGKRTYLLVPEQQVFTSESMLASLPESSALCFETISFSRLCEIVFGEVGGLTDSHASSGIRSLIMWQTLREISPFLVEYKNLKSDKAFTSLMLSLVDELRSNSVSPEDCELLSEKLRSEGKNVLLQQKISDIAAVYANWERNLESMLGESAISAEKKLKQLSYALRNHHVFEGCNIYIDSFTSFTCEEHAVLEEIIKQADNVCISFCCENRGVEAPHTESIRNTIRKLTRFSRENAIESTDLVLQANKRAKSEALLLIEDKLWNFSTKKSEFPEIFADSSVILAKCKNDLDEARFAALQILRARSEGVKFSEIAVIMRDGESRKGIIDAVFEDMNIPYFYSQKTELSTTQVSRFILSALRCISYNFRLGDVLTLLKTGLCGIEQSDADLFEDYCYTWSINGNKFLERAWSMNPDGYTPDISERGKEILAGSNRVREALISPLVTLKKKFAFSDGNTTENCRAIYEYLKDMKVSERLCRLSEFELSNGNLKEAGEILRIYDLLVSSLTDISTVFGEISTTAEEMCNIIEIMLSNTDISSVPAVNDCVTVGSAATLRVENIKLTIVLGLCEGEFPQSYSGAGILSENDKQVMEEFGTVLDSRESRIMSDELFYVYRTFTKASQRLVLCTCESSIGGKSLNPSTAFNRVLFLLPKFTPIEFDFKKIQSIYSSYFDDKKENANAKNDGNTFEINPLYVRMIFGDTLFLSKTQISSFAECPYKYWCSSVLKLREREISEISYADSGTVIHYVLEKFINRVRENDGSIVSPPKEEVVLMVDEILKEYISSINCPMPASIAYSFSRLRDLSLIMVNDILEEFAYSEFKVVATEKKISESARDALKPMEIQIYENDEFPKVSLGGTIDRIDVYDDGKKKYLRIVDYKTGDHKYDVSKVNTGEDLQLPAYLFTTAQEKNKWLFGNDSREIIPACALFLSANDSGGVVVPERSGFIYNDRNVLHAVSSNDNPQMLAGIRYTKKNTLSGKAAVDEETIKNIDGTMKIAIQNTAQGLYSGHIERTPSSNACKFCPLKASCPVAHKDY